MTKIKNKLASINPPLTEQLPEGAINHIANSTGFARQSVSRMLRGLQGSEESVKIVLIEALKIVMQNVTAKTKLTKEMKELLS